MPFCLGAVTLVISAATGCAPMKEVQPAATPALPQHFAAPADSTSIADRTYKELLSDPNLQQLLDSALRRNWDVLAALQRVEQANANYLQTRGALRPRVQGVAAAGVDKFGDYTMNGVGNYDLNKSPNISADQKVPAPFMPDFFVGVRSSWEIDIWGRLRNLKEAALLRVLQSQRGVQWLRTQLVAEVSGRYYELLALDSQREILRKNIQLQQEALQVVEAQKEGGRATELAVQQFKAQLLRTQALDAGVKQQVVAIENEINLLCGRTPQSILRGNSLMVQQVPASLKAGLPSAMLLRRPDIQQAELELRALEADLLAARKAFLPALTLTPYIGFNAFTAARLLDPTSLAAGALAGLSAPIFNRAAIKGDYNRVAAARTEALLQYQKTATTAFTEVVTSISEISNLEQQFTIKQQETQVLESAVGTAKDLYLSGYATYLEVITAQRNVVEAELELATTKRNQFLAVVNLYRALGGGWN
ncbi:efflux transporter, outer membrane factor (OMF) lipoprotein, NodT family [Cnuella takakiae]|uniref:Efflux transporter, outer membrane factor (OMF) lipoprotein, NodT family n=2 Tax=Cnuella takakiae TaxID=1302690 RepID=A0A1M4Y4J0_9BACT|nr:RND transporter [Cnuella takakiae]SHF00615.1 efflux transporter, outer membrane factor (OMF) lipoprotein, NodT family [Cnuella takakiae]